MNDARALIVDDDEHLCRITGRALEEIASCDTAHDVGSATAALHAYQYDLVLVDVRLPDASGMQLLDELRARWPQSVALMISGIDDLAVAREALDRGALGYVVKPFRIRDLRIQVTTALAASQRSPGTMRVSARARVVAALERATERRGETACAVVDVGYLPLLSAVYGPSAVDVVCSQLEERVAALGETVRPLGDLDSGSFAIAVHLDDTRSAATTARELHAALSGPVFVDDAPVPVPARVGLAVGLSGEFAADLLSRAETAVADAADQVAPFVVYNGGRKDAARMQLQLLADAAIAIHRHDLHVHYQPQFDLLSGTLVGIEALARWHHPLHGAVAPSVFILLAERMGLIGELGASILAQACADLAVVRRQAGSEELRVAVNVSPSELHERGYAERVRDVLADTGLAPSALCIEVTETLALDASPEVKHALNDLAALGVRLSIDDFGTGYAAYASLMNVPWSELKIDRSLTATSRDRRGIEMLRSMFALGKALGVDVLAEGIETRRQLADLRALGCEYGQGYLLGRPQLASDVAATGRQMRSRSLFG